ncbi:hypothetical protein [Sphingobium sp. LSP13-1-1.1]|uniref:hypothetical protein n=1 Tax=Sphingobium sp. LSP13-1-1.1 TaxID=3135234 RepID=UPI003427ED04
MVDKVTSGSFASNLAVPYLRDGLATLLIPIPSVLTELIGRIVVQWGAFELRMDALVQGTSTALQREPDERWQRLPFKKRKTLFRELMREYLSRTHQPQFAGEFDKICGTAASLHWKRNVVAHGFYQMAAPESGNPDDNIQFIAHGTHNGRDVSIAIQEDVLTELWHDIAHLGGALMVSAVKIGAALTHPELVIEDKWLLQDQPQGSFQSLPIPNTH